jgi:hypothetical protein
MKYSVHLTFISGNMTRVEVEADSRTEARNKVLNKLPPCCVESVCAWPMDEPRKSKDFGRIPVGIDSSFGALVV